MKEWHQKIREKIMKIPRRKKDHYEDVKKNTKIRDFNGKQSLQDSRDKEFDNKKLSPIEKHNRP